MDSQQETQALLGISLAIANTLDTKAMLRHVAMRIVRSTDIESVAVFQTRDSHSELLESPRLVLAVPKSHRYLSSCQRSMIDLMEKDADWSAEDSPLGPLYWSQKEFTMKVFRLPGFGYICLGEPANKLSEYFWEGFCKVSEQLAVAASGCYAHQGLKLKQTMDRVQLSHSDLFSSSKALNFEGTVRSFLKETQTLFQADWLVFFKRDYQGKVSINNAIGDFTGLSVNWLSKLIPAIQPELRDGNQVLIIQSSESDRMEPLQATLHSNAIETVCICPVSNGPNGASIGFALCLWRSSFRHELSDFGILQGLGFFLWNLLNRHNQHRTIQKYQAELEARSRESEDSASRAAEANATKSRFVAIVSHEVRTALAGMLSSLELLSDTRLDHAQRSRVSQMMRFTDHVNEIMSDVIDLAAIEEGKFNFFYSQVAIRELFFELQELLRDQASERGNTLSFVIDEGIPDYVIVDSVRTRQLVLNLLSNSLKVTRDGLVTLSVDLEPVPGSLRESLHIVVQDDGPGLPENLLNRVFQPFVKHNFSRELSAAGAGLGLAIVEALITNMGGKITLENREPVGAIASLWMPFQPTEQGPSSARVYAKNSAPIRGSIDLAGDGALSGRRILLVDDDDDVREAAQDTLRLIGCNVTCARNGKEAVQQALTSSFDLILMDCRMPEMNGFDATLEIKKRLGRERAPVVVALTAAVMQDETEVCYEAGMDDVLAKPYSRPKLRELLHSWLDPE